MLVPRITTEEHPAPPDTDKNTDKADISTENSGYRLRVDSAAWITPNAVSFPRPLTDHQLGGRGRTSRG
jgi:hypothetical protein